MSINETIEEGLSLVRNDLQHDFTIGFRCRLLSSFGEFDGNVGRRRRTKLSVLAVEKVLPIWKSSLPTDDTPYQALIMVEKVLAGTVTSEAAESEMGRLWAHCDELVWGHPNKQNAIMVGYAAIQAVKESLSEKHLGCEQVTDSSTDQDMEPYDSDSSHFAALAYSNGAPWEQSSDLQKRLEFWTWWLKSAVRAAMSAE